MEKKIMNITAIIDSKEVAKVEEVKSVNKMWIEIKKIFKDFPTANVKVFDGESIIRDLVLRKMSSGKNWMVDREGLEKAVKVKEEKKEHSEEELARIEAEKKAAEEAQKAEEKRAKKREANRLYRLRKKAKKEQEVAEAI